MLNAPAIHRGGGIQDFLFFHELANIFSCMWKVILQENSIASCYCPSHAVFPNLLRSSTEMNCSV